MNSIFTKIFAIASSAVTMLSMISSTCLAADDAQSTPITLSIGKVCISYEALSENNYTVSVPVQVFGAEQGVLSFDSSYIAFGDINSGEYSLDIGNVCTQEGKLSISQDGISSEGYNLTPSFEMTSEGFDCFSISGYCSENQTGNPVTLCVLTFTLPQTAQTGDIYNIVWYDALNSILSPEVSSLSGDYDINYSNGLVYIGSLGVTNSSQYESMYLADDTKALTSSVCLDINPDIQGHSAVDISSLISFGVNGCGSFDTTYAQIGDDAISPFDLYWGAYLNSSESNVFSGSCSIDITRFDELCSRVGEALGIELDPSADFMFFEGVLFDKQLNPIALGDFSFRIVQRGDANLDHSVDAKDAAAIAKYSSLLATLAPGADAPTLSQTDDALAKLAADINGDATHDAKDAANAAKYSSQSSISSYDAPKTYYTIWSGLLG